MHDAPIVPETKPLDDLLADLQRQRTSMAVVIDEYGRVVGIVTRRGHHRGGRRRDRRRDRPGGRRGAPAGQRRLVRARPRRRRPTSTTTASSCRSTPTPTTRSAASCSPSWGGCRGAATRSPPNGYSIRVESVRENRIEAVRIRERRAVAERRPASATATADCERYTSGAAFRCARPDRAHWGDRRLMRGEMVAIGESATAKETGPRWERAGRRYGRRCGYEVRRSGRSIAGRASRPAKAQSEGLR